MLRKAGDERVAEALAASGEGLELQPAERELVKKLLAFPAEAAEAAVAAGAAPRRRLRARAGADVHRVLPRLQGRRRRAACSSSPSGSACAWPRGARSRGRSTCSASPRPTRCRSRPRRSGRRAAAGRRATAPRPATRRWSPACRTRSGDAAARRVRLQLAQQQPAEAAALDLVGDREGDVGDRGAVGLAQVAGGADDAVAVAARRSPTWRSPSTSESASSIFDGRWGGMPVKKRR